MLAPSNIPLFMARVLFVFAFMAAGMFFSFAVAFISADLIWRGVVEITYGVLATCIGCWQLTIFLNKYIYYRLNNEIKTE